MPDTKTYVNTKEEKAYVRKVNALRGKLERGFRKSVQDYLNRVKNRIIEALNVSDTTIMSSTIDNYLKDDDFKADCMAFEVKIGTTFAEFNFSRLKANKSKKTNDIFDVLGISFFSKEWERQMIEYSIVQSSKLITMIDETTRSKVRTALEEATKKGYGADKTARLIRQNTAFSRVRATMIARTETSAGQEYGSYISAVSSGLKLKKRWLATNDLRTRPEHAIMNGVEVGFNDKFTVAGETMKYPCDPSGGKTNVINCRCTCLYVPVEN